MSNKTILDLNEDSEKVHVDVKKILLNILEKHSHADLQNMFRNFCKKFQNMKALKRLVLTLDTECYEILPDLNICDEMVKFLKDLPHLADLYIYYENFENDYDENYDDENDGYENCNYLMHNLNAFCKLKRLTLFRGEGFFDINLKELCKSNENLSHLIVEGGYEGNISDIVPFCSNLKTLDSSSLQRVDDYAALGELPQLQVLRIRKLKNDHELIHMYQKLASTNLLQELTLYPYKFLEEYIYEEFTYIDLEETKEICKIKSLKILHCHFKDYECVQYVAQLTNLKRLKFAIRNNSVDFSDSLCHILRECKQMESMWIAADGLPLNFVFQALKVLKVVRNPQEQKPLELRLRVWKYFFSSKDRKLYKSYIDLDRLVNY